MDFLFLNESASVNNNEMEAWLESTYGVSGQTDKNQSLGDFMLDYQEAMHEAEIQSMKDEFKLYQEEAMGIQHEGVIDTVKNWWRKIVEWLTKAWNKILHWIEVAYAFIRKKVQEWYMKLRSRKVVYVRKGLKAEGTAALDSLKAAATRTVQTFNSVAHDACAAVGKTSINKIEADDTSEAKEKAKEAYDEAKEAFDQFKDKFNDEDKSDNYEPMTINDWKKLVDDCVKTVDKCRAEYLKCKAEMFKQIKDVDNVIKDAYNEFKAADGTDKENKAKNLKAITRAGNVVKVTTGYALKTVSLLVSKAKFVLSKAINTARSKEKED